MSKDSVNPVPSEWSGATNLYHGSSLYETHKNNFLIGQYISFVS